MKTTAKISICLMLVLILSILAACGSDNKLEGTYCGSYTYDGNEFYMELTLNEDGTYKRVYEKNGQPYETTEGDYEVKDGKLYIYINEENSSFNKYDIVDGHLESDGRIFTKK